MKRFKDYIHAAPLSQEEWEEAVFGVEISEVLKQVDGKHRSHEHYLGIYWLVRWPRNRYVAFRLSW